MWHELRRRSHFLFQAALTVAWCVFPCDERCYFLTCSSVYLLSEISSTLLLPPTSSCLVCFSRVSLYSTEEPHTVIKGTNPNIRLDFFNTMVQTYGLHLFFFCFSVTSFISFFSKNMWVGLVRWLNFYKLLLSIPKALV